MYRPRVKPEHAPFRISEHRIRIGGVSFGIAAEIKDPTGAVWTILKNMDGTRNIEEVVEEAVKRHAEESPERLHNMVHELIGSGYIEEAAPRDLDTLSEQDKQRYDPARRYYRWLDLEPRANTWEPQERLQRARVTIIGIGGTGGVAALALAAAGIGQLQCIDPDTVELSNLSRQIIYNEADIGVPKVDAALTRLRNLNSGIKISGKKIRIKSIADVAPLADDCDVLLSTADQPREVRKWTNRACIAACRPWVDAGYHGPLVQVGVYQPGNGGCWECLHDTAQEQLDALGAEPKDAPGRRHGSRKRSRSSHGWHFWLPRCPSSN